MRNVKALSKTGALVGAAMVMLLGFVAQATAAEADLSGTWQLQIVSPGGTRTPTMVLKQAGMQLTGTYTSSRGEVPIAGSVQGNEFALKVKITTDTDELEVEYKGVVEGDALNGRVMMGKRGEANFTGKRITT